MKVKLLKKLRRRFHWFIDAESRLSTCWCYYDKKHETVNYAFVIGMVHMNDMLLYSMLEAMGRDDLYVSLRNRRESKRKQKLRLELRERFNPKK